MTLRYPFSRLVWLGIALVAVLAACHNDQTSTATHVPSLPPSATAPLVITQIVTPRPTVLPPTPTLSYDLVPVAGSWAMRFELQVNGISADTFADQIRYTASISLDVAMDGTVSSSGAFYQVLVDNVCQTQILDTKPLSFQVRGTTRPEGDQIWVDLQIIPDDPALIENYVLLCPERDDVRYLHQSILWPMLTALNKLSWSFALQSGQTFSIESNLAEDTAGQLDGQLTGKVRISRN